MCDLVFLVSLEWALPGEGGGFFFAQGEEIPPGGLLPLMDHCIEIGVHDVIISELSHVCVQLKFQMRVCIYIYM